MRASQKEREWIKLLIIGLGNPLAGDDGLGPTVVRILQQSPLPKGVKAMEGGSDALALLPVLEQVEQVLIVDVIQSGGRPGTFYRIPLQRLSEQRRGFSQHEISLLTLYQLPFSKWHFSLPDGVLFAVEVGEIELFTEGLSRTLQERIPALVEQIRQEVDNWIQIQCKP